MLGGHQQKGAELLRARAEAYGGRLDRSTVLKITLPVIVLYLVCGYCLYWSLLWSIIYGVIAFVMAFMLLVPAQISLQYYRQGLIERHLFIVSMSEALSNKSQTFVKSLHMAQFGLHGEFRQDLSRLENTIHNTGRYDPQRVASFKFFHKKYHEDTFFCQFLDTMQDSLQTGKVDQRTCDTISLFHNALYSEQQHYINQRKDRMKAIYMFAYLMIGMFMFAIAWFGFRKNYLRLWAYSFFPRILLSPIYLLVLSIALGLSYKYDHDESLMTFE